MFSGHATQPNSYPLRLFGGRGPHRVSAGDSPIARSKVQMMRRGFPLDEHSPEVLTALEAVRMASDLCRRVQRNFAGGESILKSDRSPVTVADFGSQAVLCKKIKERFPEDVIAAEEDSLELRRPSHANLLEQLTDYVGRLIPHASPEAICSWIDSGSRSVAKRYWAIDPIDGTRGFLRNDQYAIALALIEEGTVKLGLLSCPNLHLHLELPNGEKGCIFMAIKEKGSLQMTLEGEQRKFLSVSKVADPRDSSVAESIEPEHTDPVFHRRLAERLKILRSPVRMDSQAKYGILARGEVDLYLRMPSSSEGDYKEKVWDHAAGSIVAEEAGGRVTDVVGRPLDFSSGVIMEKNHGVLGSNGILHEVVLKAIKAERTRRNVAG